jgi:Flp pilus assembly protein TadD
LNVWNATAAAASDRRAASPSFSFSINIWAITWVRQVGAVAKPECEQARALLEAQFAERPEDRNCLIALAWAYVCLGRNADALRVARQAVDSLPIEKDALSGLLLLAALGEIEARTGRPEEAVKILRQLLTAPAGGESFPLHV